MAYTQIATPGWGTAPTIPITISYDRQRAGANMQYKIKISLSPLTGASYFGYPIYATVKLDGVAQVTGATLKTASPSQWSSAIVYESSWFTISNKITGTTTLTLTLYSGSGSSRSTTYNYSLIVDPAASVASISSGTLGQSQTITLTRYNTNFVTTIIASYGNKTQTIVTKTTATNVNWTPDIDFAAQAPNNSIVPITLTCITYDGITNEEIGATTITVQQAVPASIVPSLSIQINDKEELEPIYGSYIQDHSKLQIELTATGAQGSTITNHKIALYNVDTLIWTANSDNAVTPELSVSGTLTIVASVVDSRGRSTSVTETVEVLPYTSPTITFFNVSRCTANGTGKADGDYCKTVFSAEITPLNNLNIASYSVCYRLKGATTWTEIPVITSAGDYSPTDVPIIFAANINNTFEIKIDATDAFGTLSSNLAWLGPGFFLLQATSDLTGFAIGRAATKSNTLDIGLNTEIHGRLNMQGDIRFDEQTAERMLRFHAIDGDNLHIIGLYGGNPDSPIGIGIRDLFYARDVLKYDDANASLYLGDSGINLFLAGMSLALQTGLKILTNTSQLTNTPSGYSGVGRCIVIGNNNDANKYYILIDTARKLYIGTSINGATTITWAEK